MIAKAKPEASKKRATAPEKKRRPSAQDRRISALVEKLRAEQEAKRQEWLAGVADRRARALRLLTGIYEEARNLSAEALSGICARNPGYPFEAYHDLSPDGASDEAIWALANMLRDQIVPLILAGHPDTPRIKEPNARGHLRTWDPAAVARTRVEPRVVSIDGILWQALPGQNGGMVLNSTWDVPVEHLD